MNNQKQENGQSMNNFKLHEHDSGSTGVQIAHLTERIVYLTEHCRSHGKDRSSHRGLIVLVAKRKRLLKYLQRTDSAQYANVIQKLGLKK